MKIIAAPKRVIFCTPPSRQYGVVLIFSLIALTIMLIGAVALVSSFNTALTAAGNIGFKRDFQNQSERAVSLVLRQFTVGTLATPAQRGAGVSSGLGLNYSPVRLTTNAVGIPVDLVGKLSTFDAKWTAGTINPGKEIKIRYLIDRLCSSVGDAQTLGRDVCVPCSNPDVFGFDESHLSGDSADKANSTKLLQGSTGIAGSVKKPVSYRLTTRVTGPRSTEAFFQTTFCEPLP